MVNYIINTENCWYDTLSLESMTLFPFSTFFFYFSYRYSLQRTFERQTFRRGEVILTKMLGLPSEKGVYSYLKEFAPTEQSFLSNIEELLFIPLFKGIDTLSRRVTLSKVF